MTVEERLDRLERQNRWLKAGLASLLVAAVATGLLVFAPQDTIPDLVEARAFHVVDENGAVLVKLEDSFGFSLGLGGTITTLSNEGQKLVMLTATMDGEGMVRTLNGKGQELVVLGTTVDGTGAVAIMNSKGQELVRLGATEGGTGAVTTMNGEGQELVTLGATVYGGAVRTLNGKGQELVKLGVLESGKGAVSAFDPSGMRAAATLTPR